MLLVAFTTWWYGPGWRDAGDRLLVRIHETYLTFSMPILLRTMFSPWRRIITYPGASLGDRLRAGIDNLISRSVGFVMRLVTLFIGLGILALYVVLGGAIVVLWPLIPILGPALIVAGLII